MASSLLNTHTYKIRNFSKLTIFKRQWISEIHVHLTAWKMKKVKRFCFRSFSFMVSICWFLLLIILTKCTKFRGSGGSVPSCLCISLVQNFFSWAFRGSRLFLVVISWVQGFFTWLYCVRGVIVNKSNLTQNWRNWKDFFKEVNTEN